MSKTFDKKFGKEFIGNVPKKPGVYRFFSDSDRVVYVGKAKDLRARLSQYRNAKRTKAHRKMKRIIRRSVRLEFEETDNELAALLLEDQLIKELNPRLNVAGAFSFMYPSLGVKREGRDLTIAYSTEPPNLEDQGFTLFGSYRKRVVTRAAFDALEDLLGWLGHHERPNPRIEYSACRRFRQIPQDLDAPLSELLNGTSSAYLQALFLALLEKPDARREAEDVQSALKTLQAFYDEEAVRLQKILAAEGATYIDQEDWDAANIRCTRQPSA